MTAETLATRVIALRKLVAIYARPDQIALLAELTKQLDAAEAHDEPLFRKTK